MGKKHTIEKKIKDMAQVLSVKINDETARKRTFVLASGAFTFAQILKSEGLDVSFKHSLFKIPEFSKEFEMADIYLGNIRLDVRVIFDDEKFFIPKDHKQFGVSPDVYVVMKANESVSEFELVGFVKADELEETELQGEYFVYDTKILKPFKSFKKALKTINPEQHDFPSEDHKVITELTTAFLDSEISESEKVFYIKHIITCDLCRERVCEFNEFDTITSQVKNYPELLNDKTLSILTGYEPQEGLDVQIETQIETPDILETEISASMFDMVKESAALDDLADMTVIEEPQEQVMETEETSHLDDLSLLTSEEETIEENTIQESVEEDISLLAEESPQVQIEEETLEMEDSGSLVFEEETIEEPEPILEEVQEESVSENLDEGIENLAEEPLEQIAEDNVLQEEPLMTDENELLSIEEPLQEETLNEEEPSDSETIVEEEIPAEEENLEELEERIEPEQEEEGLQVEDLEDLDSLDSLDNLEETETLVEEDKEESLTEEEPLLEEKPIGLVEEEETSLVEEEPMILEEEPLEESDEILGEEEPKPIEVVSEYQGIELIDDDSEESIEENTEEITEEIIEEITEEITEEDSLNEPQDSDNEIQDYDIEEDDSQIEELQEESVLGEQEPSSLEEPEPQESQEPVQDVNPEIRNLLDDELMQLLAGDEDAPAAENPQADEKIPAEEEIAYDESDISQDYEEPEPEQTFQDDVIAGMEEDEIFQESNEDMISEDDSEIEALYEGESPMVENEEGETVLDLSKEPVSAAAASMTKKIITAAVILLLVAAGGVTAFYTKFAKPSSDDSMLPDMNSQDGSMLDLAANKPEEVNKAPEPALAQDINKSMTNVFSDQPAAITITKISWEVSQKLASQEPFRNYLQIAGKNLQQNLQNDLTFTTDTNYNNKIKVSLEIGKDKAIKRIQTTESSGSEQIDKVVLQSIKDTLKYIDVPDIKDYNGNYNLSIVINF